MGGRNVEKANEIRADIKTHALLSRSSRDIHADIFTLYGSNSMFLFTDWLGNSVQTWCLL